MPQGGIYVQRCSNTDCRHAKEYQMIGVVVAKIARIDVVILSVLRKLLGGGHVMPVSIAPVITNARALCSHSVPVIMVHGHIHRQCKKLSQARGGEKHGRADVRRMIYTMLEVVS